MTVELTNYLGCGGGEEGVEQAAWTDGLLKAPSLFQRLIPPAVWLFLHRRFCRPGSVALGDDS